MPVIKNVDVPSNITLQFINSGQLSIEKGVTVRLANPPNAGKVQIFAGLGSVKFMPRAPVTINPRWWGAKGDGHNDDTKAIQKAIDSTEGVNPSESDVLIVLDRGTYKITNTLTITKWRTHIRGDGIYATTIQFDPSSKVELQLPGGKVKVIPNPDIPRAFLFSTGVLKSPGVLTTLFQCSLSHLSLVSPNKNTSKIGISLVDVSRFVLEQVAWFQWSGRKSIGLEIRGRELTTIRGVNIQADIPIVIADQPGGGVDCDVFHFSDIYLDALDDTEPCVLIKDGVIIQDLTIDGSNHFNGGSGAIYWKSTKSSQISNNVRICNIRYEKTKARRENTYGIYIDYGDGVLYGLTLDNVYIPGLPSVIKDDRGRLIREIPTHGFYLRQIQQASLRDCRYFGSSPKYIALNVDKSVHDLSLWNTYFHVGCDVKHHGLKIVSAGLLPKSKRPLPSTCFFNEED